MVSVALGAINPKTPYVDVLFPALAPVIAYSDFRAIAVLDLANQLALAGTLKKHPGADHLDKLRRFIESKNEEEFSDAVSACLALAFIPGDAAEKLLLAAEAHPDSNVRLEATYALARRNHPGSDQKLAKAALDPTTSRRATGYLTESGKAGLIPREVNDPVFAAKSEMLSWLAHPTEYGRPPESIELWDRRTIYWPPTDDKREMFLFKYVYPPKKAGEAADVGVGLVGSVTFSLFGETRPAPQGTPEDALATHCVWELENKGDPRGKGRKIEVGRKLLGFKAAK
ncbi:MAG: HEAT repeat domain-containing protein [Archangiaceae bacterium]|nr:HEAT repeat domain-containing protein [Archangiaceae bacterium]